MIGNMDPITLRTCPICDAVFAIADARANRKRYCSEACLKKAKRAQLAAGRAGKSPAKRRPLAEFARDSGWKLRRDVERLERIFNDDRFGLNKQQVAAVVSGHLEYAAKVCQDLLSRIPLEGE